MKEDLKFESKTIPHHRVPYKLLDKCVPDDIRKELMREIPKNLWEYVGKKIHIKSRNGMYDLLGLVPNGMIITSKTMRHHRPYELRPFDDFKCLAGGKWNLR